MQSLDLCRGEVDQLQEVASTNGALLSDSYSFSQILPDHTSWHYQIQYSAAMQSAALHQGERLVEAKELHQNNFQYKSLPDILSWLDARLMTAPMMQSARFHLKAADALIMKGDTIVESISRKQTENDQSLTYLEFPFL
jgi:hypothetical protein